MLDVLNFPHFLVFQQKYPCGCSSVAICTLVLHVMGNGWQSRVWNLGYLLLNLHLEMLRPISRLCPPSHQLLFAVFSKSRGAGVDTSENVFRKEDRTSCALPFLLLPPSRLFRTSLCPTFPLCSVPCVVLAGEISFSLCACREMGSWKCLARRTAAESKRSLC